MFGDEDGGTNDTDDNDGEDDDDYYYSDNDKLDSSCWVLSDEYPFTRVSVIFQFFCIILYWPN